MERKIILAWSLYDLANTAINTIIFTFVFSVYFARGVYGDEVAGSASATKCTSGITPPFTSAA